MRIILSKYLTALLIGGILVVCLIAGFLLFSASSSDHEKQAIQNLLQTRATALIQKDLPRYLSCFSLQYRSGSRTYDDLQTHASQWFDQFVTIRFSFQILDIQIQGKKAIVEDDYKFSLTNIDGEAITIAKRELLEIRREKDEWKIIKSLAIQ